MILTLPDAWSPVFCREVRTAMDRGSATPAEIFDGDFIVDRRVRDVLEVDVEAGMCAAVEARIAAVREQVASFFALPLAGSEGPSFLRYRAGGFYRRHRDCAGTGAGTDDRRVSLVIFLNGVSAGSAGEGFAGGSLRLYPDGPLREDSNALAEEPAIDIVPREGLLVAFPADMPHEVLAVARGVRDAVVDWYW